MELLQAILNEITLTNIGFILAMISIVFIGINIRAIINQNDNAIRSERNERFKNAIEQLGSEKNTVALGGIYTLHRIAQEDESYRENVFNILCSFVRDVTTTDDYKEKYKDKPSEPIQTILNILCINENDYNVYKKYIIDFSDSNLTGAYLNDSNLLKAKLISTNLSKANLSKANLTEAHLLGATITNSNLVKSNLTNAFIFLTNLRESNLSDANLTMANLSRTNLIKANLEGANLRATHLFNTNLTGADLKGVNLKGVTSFTDPITYPRSFEKSIIAGIGRETDLSGIVGGYNENNPPFTGNPIFGSYNEEEAKQMIEEYKNSLK